MLQCLARRVVIGYRQNNRCGSRGFFYCIITPIPVSYFLSVPFTIVALLNYTYRSGAVRYRRCEGYRRYDDLLRPVEVPASSMIARDVLRVTIPPN
jgi:hypothetical protein